ncbi:MAG TPA: response regulator transcription factor [Usitatibacter sp.]|nr:response regulator transcription factor [Usitatibacter sp.]
MSRILLVEDDAALGEGVKAGLEDEAHAVEWVRDGRLAREALRNGDFGVVVLDLTLPRLDGIEVLRELRARGDRTPVLILTARDTIDDRVKGLDAGADDYLVKPFALVELKARVRSLARRAAGGASNRLEHNGVVIDRETRRVTCHGRPVDLSAREYALLEALLERPGRTLSRAQLEERIYPWGQEVESNAIEVHVHHLRGKLFPELIRTVRGVGYALHAGDD